MHAILLTRLPPVSVCHIRYGLVHVMSCHVMLCAVPPGVQGIVRASPLLASQPAFSAVCNLSTLDVMAVRLWLDRRLAMPTHSNVLAGIDAGVGVTAFDLTALQDQYRGEAGSVVELDFYHASPLLPMSDEDVVKRCLKKYLAGTVQACRCMCHADW